MKGRVRGKEEEKGEVKRGEGKDKRERR